MGHSIQYASPTFLFRDICHSKLGHIMHRLEAIGFEGLELYGMFGLSSEEILSFQEESGLAIVCDHIHYEEFSNDTLNVITRRTALGAKYLTIDTIPPTMLPGTDLFQKRSVRLSEYPAFASAMEYSFCITTTATIS